ncbi:MAG: DUF362 domain-containing protein [Firmicutes bacterium]|nr:DUF362 domain-containing protein [Bacillota bacterium]
MAQVSLVKVENGDIRQAVQTAIDLIGGMGRFVKRGDVVLIKPNLFVPQKEDTGLITSPRVIKAVALLVKELGGEIVIGERTSSVYSNLEDSGLDDIAKIISFDDAPRRDIRISGAKGLFFDVPMPKIVDDCQVFINLPGLRTHALTLMSNALKNLMGLLPRDYTRMVHLCGLDRSIIDINMYRPSQLVVTDAIICAEGNFPGPAKPLPLNLIIAGDNPVAVDAVASRIVGYSPGEVDHLVEANRRGLGPIHLKDIELKGLSPEPYHNSFEKAHTTIDEFRDRVTIIAPAVCNSCRQALGCGLKQAEELGWLGGETELVVIAGPVETLPDISPAADVLLYGNCAGRWHEHGVFERGCPPLGGQVIKALREMGYPKK